MRKELYKAICERLSLLYSTGDGDYGVADRGVEVPEGWERAIRHIDLWNHNVEFIEQEEAWGRPAVFVEFAGIDWRSFSTCGDYCTEGLLRLHVVTDWCGSVSEGSVLQDEGLELFDLLDAIHACLLGLEGRDFHSLDLVRSETNHNHEDVVESVEVYRYEGFKRIV